MAQRLQVSSVTIRYSFGISPNLGTAAISEVPHWSGSFSFSGISYAFNMVGTSPFTTSITTTIPTVIQPITFTFSGGVSVSPAHDGAGQFAHFQIDRVACKCRYVAIWLPKREDGKALLCICEIDLEGIVAMHKSSSYIADRGQSTWYKIRNKEYSQKDGREDLFERERH